MNTDEFPYDVALSFLAEDESLAIDIAKSLPNLKTFVYSERQAEIGGTDGAETFSNVFGRDARIVVVLYRPKWGTTKWTRIEETAVKDRVLNDGPNFLTLIHLEPGKSTPKWMPQTRLWVDFGRLGLNGAVSIIEERVRQSGGAVREETAEENAERLRREMEAQAQRLAFLHSQAAVVTANEFAADFFTELERLANNTSTHSVRTSNGASLYRDGFTIEVWWSCPYWNTLADSTLQIIEWRGRPDFGSHRYARTKPDEELRRHELDFDRELGERVWRYRKGGTTTSSVRLADFAIKLLLERVRNSRTTAGLQ